MGLLISIILGVVFIEIFSPSLRTVATDPITEVDSITTAAAVTTATLTLNNESWHNDNTSLTVVCATDAAPGFTLGVDRVSVALTGLTAATTQDCTSNYITEGSEDFINIIKVVPLLAAIGVVSAAFGAIALGGLAVAGRSVGVGGQEIGGGISVANSITALVGLLLIETISSFTGSATTEYANQPEFTGVSSLLSLVVISYVLAVVSILLGGGASIIRGRSGGKRKGGSRSRA